MSEAKRLVVGIGGTVRPSSTSERALRVALDAAERAGARTVMLGGADLQLPLYNPADATSSGPQSQRLLGLVQQCDGLIISTPGYHGLMSGLVKNALDYFEDLRTDARPYLHNRAVGCIAAAGGWQAVGSTLASLRAVVHALRGWPTPMGAGLNSATKLFDDTGKCLDDGVKMQLELVGTQVAEFADYFHTGRSHAKARQPVGPTSTLS